MKQSWSSSAAAVAAIAGALWVAVPALARPAPAQAPSVRIQQPAAPQSGEPATVELDNVMVPRAGAVVTVNVRGHGAKHATTLATMFIVGSQNLTGTRRQSLSAAIGTAPSVVSSLAHDRQATVTVVVCKTGGTCSTSKPLPVAVVQPPAGHK